MIEYAPSVHGTYMPKRRYPILSKWLQAHQRDYNWTYKQLSERMGVHTNVIYLYKNGKCFPIASKLAPLSKGLAELQQIHTGVAADWKEIVIKLVEIAEIDQRKQ